jgi:putative transposase
MNKQHITLSDADRSTLTDLLAHGTLSARTFKRATALLELDRGKTLQQVAATLQVTYPTVSSWRDNYNLAGLRCLDDAPRSGRPIEIDGTQRAKITALACSDAPDGHARWSLRLLADKAVESGLCEHVSHALVGDILKKTT